MTPAEYNSLSPDNQKIAYLLIEILQQLKAINRQVEIIEHDENVNLH